MITIEMSIEKQITCQANARLSVESREEDDTAAYREFPAAQPDGRTGDVRRYPGRVAQVPQADRDPYLSSFIWKAIQAKFTDRK
jgi:hypothetical protein